MNAPGVCRGEESDGRFDATRINQHSFDLAAGTPASSHTNVYNSSHLAAENINLPLEAPSQSNDQSLTKEASDSGKGQNESGFPSEVVYPRKNILIILTLALMTAVFMIALDTNIIGQREPDT